MNLLNNSPLRYYSLPHLSMLLISPIIVITLYYILRNKTKKTQSIVLFVLAILNALLYLSYKLAMAFTYDTFIILNELPLHLCNLNLVLIPIAIATKNKLLMSYFYYVGLIAAFCGVMFFDSYFLGRETYSYIVLVYFIYHSILIAFPILFISLKFFTPSLNYIWKSLLLLLGLATIMLIVNIIFRTTGICPEANYFYTMGMPDNPILGMLMKFIPVPLLYCLPIIPVLYLFGVLITLPNIIKNHRNKSLKYEVIG